MFEGFLMRYLRSSKCNFYDFDALKSKTLTGTMAMTFLRDSSVVLDGGIHIRAIGICMWLKDLAEGENTVYRGIPIKLKKLGAEPVTVTLRVKLKHAKDSRPVHRHMYRLPDRYLDELNTEWKLAPDEKEPTG
jgi:hypothetical protein